MAAPQAHCDSPHPRPAPSAAGRALLPPSFRSLLAGVAGCLAALAATTAAGAGDDPPPGVKMLLPRNGIPSISNPVFVPAAEAEIPDDAWVLGVVIGDEARAYSLNLLNRHEIVNDRVDGRPIAAVW